MDNNFIEKNNEKSLISYFKENDLTPETQDLSESTLLITGADDLALNIMRARYLEEVQKEFKHVLFLCPEALCGFLELNYSDIKFYPTESTDTDDINFDYYIAIQDLTKLFGFAGTNYANSKGYLKADSDRTKSIKNQVII